MSDHINHPSHYQGNGRGIECIDAIEAIGIGPDFCRGNVIKYLWRMGLKGDPLEDARKAQWYLNRLVKMLESEQAPDAPVIKPAIVRVDQPSWKPLPSKQVIARAIKE